MAEEIDSDSAEESLGDLTNSDDDYVPVAPVKQDAPAEIINPLKALLHETLSKSKKGQKIIEKDRQRKEEAERLANFKPEKPPSPKFKIVAKLRGTFPEPQTFSQAKRKSSAYTGIGNDVYNTYDYFKVEIPPQPSQKQLREAEQAAIAKQIEEEKEEELKASMSKKAKKPRFDPKLNKIKELDRKVNAVLNNETGKVAKKKAFQRPLFERDKRDEESANAANLTMTGFKLTPAQKQEISEDVNRRTASVTQYLKNLDA